VQEKGKTVAFSERRRGGETRNALAMNMTKEGKEKCSVQTRGEFLSYERKNCSDLYLLRRRKTFVICESEKGGGEIEHYKGGKAS